MKDIHPSVYNFFCLAYCRSFPVCFFPSVPDNIDHVMPNSIVCEKQLTRRTQ